MEEKKCCKKCSAGAYPCRNTRCDCHMIQPQDTTSISLRDPYVHKKGDYIVANLERVEEPQTESWEAELRLKVPGMLNGAIYEMTTLFISSLLSKTRQEAYDRGRNDEVKNQGAVTADIIADVRKEERQRVMRIAGELTKKTRGTPMKDFEGTEIYNSELRDTSYNKGLSDLSSRVNDKIE